MSSASSEKLPPLPRLRSGRLLPNAVEVASLFTTIGDINIYKGLADEIDPVFIIESQTALDPFRNQEAHIFPQPLLVFEAEERFYRIVPAPAGPFFLDDQMACNQRQVVDMILSLIEVGGYLENQGYDLSLLNLEGIYREEERWRFLLQPPIQDSDLDLGPWILGFVRELLGNRLTPGDTRDLGRPLKRLCFGYEVEELLTRFLEERVDVQDLYVALDNLRLAPDPVWDIVGVTHPGQERSRNEDAFGYMSFTSQTARRQGSIQLLAVADGMGGHEMGDRASDLAINLWFKETMSQARVIPFVANTNVFYWLNDCFQQVQSSMLELTRNSASLTGKPGTTFVGGAIIERNLFLVNCGDSRAYRLGGKGLERLSHDFSLVQTYIDQGDLTEAEAFGHHSSNVITTYLGIEPRFFRYDQFVYHLNPADRLLFCSDGLTDLVPEPEILKIFAACNSAEQAAHQLVDAANRAGGRDNITVLVLFDTSHATGSTEPGPTSLTPSGEEQQE